MSPTLLPPTPVPQTPVPQTLLQMKGVSPVPPALSASALIIIDAQEEYRSGPLALPGLPSALSEAAAMLARARAAGIPVLHVVHQGAAGGAFDLDAPRGAILPEVAPLTDEPVIRKTKASAFAGTELQDHLTACGSPALILIGFMTHNCVAATAHAAAALGYTVTLVSQATGTRSLPGPNGTVLSAEDLNNATLSGLSDTIARIVPTAAAFPD